MECDRIREQLEAYALDALEPAERAEVERHLEACDECRRIAVTLAELVALFPQAVTYAAPAAPSDEVKARLLAAVSAQSMLAGQRSSIVTREPSVRRSDTPGDAGRSPRRAWRTFAYAVPVVLLIFSLAWGFRLAGALERERDLKIEYLDLLDEVVGEQELVFEVIGFNDTDQQFLQAQQADSTSYGKVFTRPSMPYVVVMAGRLPEAPSDATFHVWITADGRASLAGELTVDDHGFGLLVYTVEEPGPNYDAAFVTLQSPSENMPAGTEILRNEANGAS